MSLANDLVGVGVPSMQAERLGWPAVAAVTTAGTTQGTATAIGASQRTVALTTAASQTGAILPSAAELMAPYLVYNTTATTGVLYPPSGGAFNGGSANAGVNVAQNKCALVYRVSATAWAVIVGA